MLKSRTLFLLLAVGLLALWYFAARGNKHPEIPASDRPNDPWVFRSVLDKQPRMITFALDDHLWVAYSTDSCALYKAWSGSAAFEGAVYNMRHGPQPMSVGPAWFENTHKRPWVVKTSAGVEMPRTDYKGHRYTKGGHAEIMYDLVLASGQRIRINEQPELVKVDGQRGFQRTFTVTNAPAGAEIMLRTNVASIADASAIATNGAWKTVETKYLPQVSDNLSTMTVDGELTLRNDGATTLTTMFVALPCIPNPFDAERKAAAESEQTVSPGERLMAKNDCRTCHNPQVQTVGPGYAQIAQRYKNTPENIEKLAKKVMAGGSGVWGAAAMSAHPDLQPEDAKSMVAYVLSLDEGEDDGEGGPAKSLADIPANKWLSPEKVKDADLLPGLVFRLYQFKTPPHTFAETNYAVKPDQEGVVSQLEAGTDGFGDFRDNFGAQAEGYLFLEKDDNVVLQLSSDDGSRLYVDGQLLINHDGWHGSTPKEAEVALRAGYHPIRIDYFQGGGGRGLFLKWARSGDPLFKTIPPQNLARIKGAVPDNAANFGGGSTAIPGDGAALKDVHPAYTLTQARPDEFLPKVAGMDFLSDGRLVVSTWDAMGGVYLLENVASGDPKKIKVKRIAKGLAEPLGLKVVDDTIFVLQKQELTKLIDTDGDDIIDEYQCFAKGWLASANFHEFAFGLAYQEGYFYAALATAIMPGGASARPQILDRGKCVKISRQDGSIEFVARGLRTPDGVGTGANGEIFITDNQGDWLPSSKLLLVKPGAFFGSYSVDSTTVASMPVTPPVVWLPQDEIGNSPTQPSYLKDGPYQGQVIFGDVCYGGLQRVFTETVNDVMQGCVFRFSQGFEGATHRLAWGPDGALYLGMIGNPGNWGQEGKLWYGLQRMKYNGASVFEMLAVRAKTNGMEIEFTEPLREGDGWDAYHYLVKQWWYKPTPQYGGPKLDEETLNVASATVSDDRKKVFLEIPGLKPGHVVNIHLRNLPLSDLGHEIWTTDAWYTLNNIPANTPGEIRPHPPATPPVDNTLSAREKAEGWTLLFDGQSLNGWHNYGKNTIGSAWVVADNAIHLDAKPRGEGEWQQKEGGDILTSESYKDFELELDWKIGPCGNSGIFYNVIEDPAKYNFGWMTGPEMQVLDNACHPDARIPKHRAGDLYDMISCKYETVRPAGEWNHVRIVSKNGKIEHWLNYRKLVEYDQNSPEWPKMIAASKFKEWAAFGTAREGKIALQDHGDPVWYKNIKIRRL